MPPPASHHTQQLAWRQSPGAAVLHVSPGKIRFGPTRVACRGRRVVAGGDWDQAALRERVTPTSPGTLNELMTADGPWNETAPYRSLLRSARPGRKVLGCPDRHSLRRKLARLETVFTDMRRNGYRDPDPDDRVGVSIGRHGELILAAGRCRWAFARHLGLSGIPVSVHRVHLGWERLRREIAAYVQDRYQGHGTYAPLLHPDLQDFQSIRGHHRFEAIERHLPVADGSVLDLGAEWGYFSQRFAMLGFQVTAVENDPQNVYFLERLRDAAGLHFAIQATDVLSLPEPRADIVLALGLIHHFLKYQPLFERLVAFLGRLRAGWLFLQAHCPDEPLMQGAYRNLSPSELVRFVLDHSHFESVLDIGLRDGLCRPVFLLQGARTRRR